jgi:GST-like protein
MYVLYGSRGSGSAAVEMGLHAAGLPCRVVRASRWEDDSAQEELRTVNPLMQIPTLVLPSGAVMTESAAILAHIGLEAAAGLLLPADAVARAQALRGLVYIPANCYSGITVIDYPQRFTTTTDEASLEAIRQGTRKTLHRNWEIFADTFPGKPFLNGDAPGALDFLAVVVSKWAGTRQHLREHRPQFSEMLERVQAHERVAPIYQLHWDN